MKKIILGLLLVSTFAIAQETAPGSSQSLIDQEVNEFSPKTKKGEKVPSVSPLEENKGAKAGKSKKADRPHPCAMIERVCKQAGFTKWAHRDCIIPILKGKPVDGVKTEDISNQQIKACQMEKKSIHY